MKILVTGGAGYVGSVLVSELLAAGHQVRVLDNLSHGGRALLAHWTNPSFEFFKGDVRDSAVVKQAVSGVNAVVHLAAIVGDPACAREPELANAVNLEGSLSVLRESQKAGVSRFVFASTCSNYGKMKDPARYVDEESDLTPVSLYARTKVAIEEAVLDPSLALCATSLRLATVFGTSPRMRFDLTVNEFTYEMATTKKLLVFGKQFWRPYIHVRDVARGIMTVLTAAESKVKSRVFNVGSTRENYTKDDLVRLIGQHVPDAVVEFVEKAEDPRDYRVSFARIETELGFTVTRTVPDGIAEVLRLARDGVVVDGLGPEYRN